MIILTVYSFDM